MPFKSKAQRRKFAQLLVEGKISDETYEEWNRSTGGKELPERVGTAEASKTAKKKAAEEAHGRVSREDTQRAETDRRQSAPPQRRSGPPRSRRPICNRSPSQRRSGRAAPDEVSKMEPTAPTVPESSTHIDMKLAAIGVVSGIVAAMAMDAFSRLIRRRRRRPRGARARRGRRARRPRHAAGSGGGLGEQDATVKVGTAAFRSVTGYKPGRETQQWLGTAAHYAFGAAVGVNYMLASERAPDLRRGFGTVYGSLVWAAADEGAVPAAGLSKKPGEIPLGVHAYALGAHWVYGATLEACRRIAAAILEAWERSGGVIDVTALKLDADRSGARLRRGRRRWLAGIRVGVGGRVRDRRQAQLHALQRLAYVGGVAQVLEVERAHLAVLADQARPLPARSRPPRARPRWR